MTGEEYADQMQRLCLDATKQAQEIELLKSALKPFAALLDRRWQDKDDSIKMVRDGGFVSELQAIELEHVLRAHDLLYAR